MIQKYTDHAANERTFLAWLRTGLSIAAFGFLIERFNLFLAELGELTQTRAPAASRLRGLVQPLGRYDGFAFCLIGVAIIVIGATHFVRTGREIDRAEPSRAEGPRPELILSGLLVLLAASYCVYLALQ